MRIKDLISEAESLPVEERARVIDSLLRSMNPPESEVDTKWADIARERLDDIRSGAVSSIPGEEVFNRVRERLEK
ncbi:addiction module protein [Wenzhouxiangella sp. EGI_FJ10305]|uniref:addiction module protein n=1 Tax=Wenzhouxiangella sp. EGI_FJ10305 TaxID=3243768 RepID=UPI0035DD3DBC